MDAFIVIFLAAFLLYCIPSILLTIKPAGVKEPEKALCPPHKWEYRGHGEYQYMVCGACHKFPGIDLSGEVKDE